jgi:hypothetical protein
MFLILIVHIPNELNSYADNLYLFYNQRIIIMN